MVRVAQIGERHDRLLREQPPERIAAPWWRHSGMPTRDYFRAEDFSGRRFWLYRAGLYRADVPSRWFLHGVFA